MVCSNCGFIFNAVYDFSVHENTDGHDDQQGFSPTFMEFANRVASKILNKYDVKEKQIIELGCGKGDFLKLLCQIGDNKGIGIDPAAPLQSDNESVSFLKERYNASHADIKSDLVACRHTLEHIHKPNEFIGLLAENLQKQEPQPVLFELPDTTRILKELAFWGIYYEHCSYFTTNSLAYLFESKGFKIKELWLDYNGLYLMLDAVSGKDKSSEFSKLKVEETLALARQFNDRLAKKKQYWLNKLKEYKLQDKKVVLWGGGSKPVGFLTLVSEYSPVIEAVVDINPKMNGKFMPGFGIELISPERLSYEKPDAVIIMNGIYLKEISNTINSLGLQPEIISL